MFKGLVFQLYNDVLKKGVDSEKVQHTVFLLFETLMT